MADENKCWKCATHYPANVVFCIKCGINLKTGDPVASALDVTSAEDSELTFPLRILQWVADTLPGLMRVPVLIVSIFASVIAFLVLTLSLSLILVAPLSAFPIGAVGLVILAQAVTWMIQGEFRLMQQAMAEFRGKDWTTFVMLVFAPLIFGFVFLKKAQDREQASAAPPVQPAVDKETLQAAADRTYVISSLRIGDRGLGGEGLCADAAGNIYAAAPDACTVFKLDAATGIVSVFAGSGEKGVSPDGTPAASAMLVSPRAVCADRNGNVYISDAYWIRKVDAAGKLSLIAGSPGGSEGDGGPAKASKFLIPIHMAVDNNGNIYISERLSNRIRKIDSKSGIITTIAGTGTAGFGGDGGPASTALLNNPMGITVDKSNVYVADLVNNRIRKINNQTGIISTIAGDGTSTVPSLPGLGGPATKAAITQPLQITADLGGNVFFTCTGYFNRVLKIDSTTGVLSIVAGGKLPGFSGDDGPSHLAQLSAPGSLFTDAAGTIYIGDAGNTRVRKLEKQK